MRGTKNGFSLMKLRIHHAASALFLLASHVSAAVLYVDVNSTSPTLPYTNWSTAAAVIQDAVDAATNGDTVMVNDGVYGTGGRIVDASNITNRLVVTKPITVQSVNGPGATTIMGYRGDGGILSITTRCAFLTNGAALIGFTLTNGSTGRSAVSFNSSGGEGGGVYTCSSPFVTNVAVLSNCILTGCSANYGGGAYGVTLNNCIVMGNSATVGGGAYGCILNNCIVSSNTASGTAPQLPPPGSGGGVYFGKVNNCLVAWNTASSGGGGVCNGSVNNTTIVSNTAPAGGGVCSVGTPMLQPVDLTNSIIFYNSATNGPNYFQSSTAVFVYCCTTPLPTGTGNITNEPIFLSPSDRVHFSVPLHELVRALG